MFKRNFLSLIGLSVLIYPLSFVNQLLISYFFGTSEILDTYWLSMSIAMMLIIHVQPVKEILVNEYYPLKSIDPQKANRYLSANIYFWLLLLIIGVLIYAIWPSQLITITTKNISSENLYLASDFLRLLAIYTFFLFFSELLGGILIAHGMVVYQSLGKLMMVIGSIIFLFTLFNIIGELTLVYGILTGLVLLIILQIISLKRLGVDFLQLTWPRVEMNFLGKIGGLVFVALINQVYMLYERVVFAGLSPGLISAFQYGRSLHDIPNLLFVIALQTSLWPAYLEAVNQGQMGQIYEMTVKKIKWLILFFIWITLMGSFFSESILYLLYFRGAFGTESLELTSMSLKAIILGLLPLGILTILGRALYAYKAIKWISISGIAGVLVGSIFLVIADSKGSIDWAIHHFFACQLAILSVVGIGFLKFTEKINSINFWALFFMWGLRAGVGVIGVAWIYPFPVFEMSSKWNVFWDLVFHGLNSTIILAVIWLLVGILNKGQIKRIGNELSLMKIKLRK